MVRECGFMHMEVFGRVTQRPFFAELKKLEKEQSDGRAEISNLNSQVPTHSRMRKNDVSLCVSSFYGQKDILLTWCLWSLIL